MKRIIFLISLCSLVTALQAADKNAASDSYGLLSGSTYTLDSNYSITAGLVENNGFGSTDYSLFSSSTPSDSLDFQGAWVGVAGEYGQLKLGSHEALDSVAITGADQQRNDSAYDLLIQDDVKLSQSFSYLGKASGLTLGAQLATEDTDLQKSAAGLLLNAQSKSVEAAIGYRRTTDKARSVKGRLTYKSRNNSRVRVDLVAEKVAVDDDSESTLTDSTSFMVGAKYRMTPKAYVVGQYGVVGFEESIGLSSDGLIENKDYNALSLEAGYSLSGNTSVYINHTQKSFDSELQRPFASDIAGSQTNSIGVRLNW